LGGIDDGVFSGAFARLIGVFVVVQADAEF
jgi:hypothetical protein